jgi:hypothetical protein
MSSVTVFQVAMGLNGLTDVEHPLLKENYQWVDELLREKYYGYALTSDNVDEFESAGLLQEHYDWVDIKLADMCHQPLYDGIVPLCYIPFTWCNHRTGVELECIEDSDDSLIGRKRNRSESDISDYEEEVFRVVNRLSCQSPPPIPTKYIIIIPTSVYEKEYNVDIAKKMYLADDEASQDSYRYDSY